ncbi:Hypothetical protein CINCED_3A025832 [Cinara cedri]|uniref:Uncharacterized protein n=1 Tax=Cinara cedri TaxID=506608 RepID=A0A5E4MRP1_9HEMI|nr:Hypothetical protein CINCED_3A025832 [Cinara cedri]
MFLRSALIVLKTTQPTLMAAQFIKNSIIRYPAHQAIEYIIILIPKPLIYKVAIHLITLFLINSPQMQTYAQATSNIPGSPPPTNDTQPPDLSKSLINTLDTINNTI